MGFGSDLCAAFGIDFLSFTPRCLLPLGLGVSCTGWPALICVFQVEPVQILLTWARGMFVGFPYRVKAIAGPGGPSDLSTLSVGETFVLVSFLSLGAHKIPRLKACQGHRKAEEKPELWIWGGMSGDKGRKITNENTSKTLKTRDS